jgi:hypothetical protein
MFENEFSLDWLEELTAMKVSRILSLLEEGVQNGFSSEKNPRSICLKATGKDRSGSKSWERTNSGDTIVVLPIFSYANCRMMIQKPLR